MLEEVKAELELARRECEKAETTQAFKHMRILEEEVIRLHLAEQLTKTIAA